VATRALRTIIPGKVAAVTRAADGELDVIFSAGIGSRSGGGLKGDGSIPGAPAMFPGGGGWSMLWPLAVDDEGLGVVSDRAIARWRNNRTVGDADAIDTQHHDLSDLIVLPFALTAPAPAPAAGPGPDWLLTGPQGEAMRFGGLDGAVTISKAGATVATISMGASGSVVIDVALGQTVAIGDAGAVALAKADALDAAMTAMFVAGVGAGTGAVGTTGTLAFTAAQIAYDAAKATIATTKAKGT
jgi:hypothetical protein